MRKLDLQTIIIILLVVVILLMKMCTPKIPSKPGDVVIVEGKKYEVIKRITDTQYIPHVTKIYKPGEIIIRDTIIYVKVPQIVDTNEILKDYYSKVVYIDTIKFKDSVGYVSLIDTISKNSILGRNWYANIKQKIIRDSIFLKETPKRQLYVGPNMGYDKIYGFNYLGAAAIYKDKKDRLYSLGVGTNSTTKSTMIQGGMYIKIKLNKE